MEAVGFELPEVEVIVPTPRLELPRYAHAPEGWTSTEVAGQRLVHPKPPPVALTIDSAFYVSAVLAVPTVTSYDDIRTLMSLQFAVDFVETVTVMERSFVASNPSEPGDLSYDWLG